MFENCGVLVTDNGSYHRFEPEYSSKNELGNFKDGKCVGIHLEPGPDGGLVMLDDTTVLDRALNILREEAE